MYERYPLFHSHIDLAHKHWKSLVKPGDTVIDATCGNGHDTLVLAQITLTNDSGQLFALDLQQEAIDASKQMLLGRLGRDLFDKIHFVKGCHSRFPETISPSSVKLIAYNLGYLPGGDKTKTTQTETTLESIKNAQELIQDGGLISITCYPGHNEGKREEDHIIEFTTKLDPKKWSCCHHRWSNRTNAPSLLLIQKRLK
jgi:hypothetical protein